MKAKLIEWIDRVTGVEGLLSCPYKATYVPRASDVDTLIKTTMGDIGHLAHRHPDLAEKVARRFFGETMVKMTGQRDNVSLDICMQVIEMAKDRIQAQNEKGYVSYGEAKASYVCDGVVVTGGWDELLITPNNRFFLNDFKVVKSADYYGGEEKIDGEMVKVINKDRKQRRHYSNFVFNDFPELEELTFSYVCYIKNKTVKRLIFSQNITREQAKYEVEKDIAEYRAYKDNGYFPCKKNKMCFSCPLYKAETAKGIGMDQCPMYKLNVDIIDSGEIDIIM